jgi:hypothetical protein
MSGDLDTIVQLGGIVLSHLPGRYRCDDQLLLSTGLLFEQSMRRWVNVGIFVLVAVIAGALLLRMVGSIRHEANLSTCRNNLRQTELGLHNYLSAYGSYPAATMTNPELPPERRLNWLFELDPFVHARMDPEWIAYRMEPWDSENNLRLARQRMRVFACPEAPTDVQESALAITSYVGAAGVGTHAAALPKDDPRCGVFGNDRRVKITEITDGLETTILIIETGLNNGPWIAGGQPTTRGYDLAGQPPIGHGRQFGGNHRGVALVALADGSVRALHELINPAVLQALFSIAGGDGPNQSDIRLDD